VIRPSPPPPEPVAPATELGELLRRHARRIELLAEQLDALGQHELARFQTLADEFAALEHSMLAVPDAEDDAGAAPVAAEPCANTAIAIAVQRIEDEWASLHRLREHIEALNEGALHRVRDLRPLTRGPGRYLEPSRQDVRLNVKL
jgi:hypothetical protein